MMSRDIDLFICFAQSTPYIQTEQDKNEKMLQKH